MMKILIEIEFNDRALEMSWVRQMQMFRTVAEDVSYMMNEKHEDVYRSTTMFVNGKEF